MKYQEKQAEIRNKAIEWQNTTQQEAMSWYETAQWQNYFANLGKKYGLLKEFKANGIL